MNAATNVDAGCVFIRRLCILHTTGVVNDIVNIDMAKYSTSYIQTYIQ